MKDFNWYLAKLLVWLKNLVLKGSKSAIRASVSSLGERVGALVWVVWVAGLCG